MNLPLTYDTRRGSILDVDGRTLFDAVGADDESGQEFVRRVNEYATLRAERDRLRAACERAMTYAKSHTRSEAEEAIDRQMAEALAGVSGGV